MRNNIDKIARTLKFILFCEFLVSYCEECDGSPSQNNLSLFLSKFLLHFKF